jgi:hypothetical protein
MSKASGAIGTAGQDTGWNFSSWLGASCPWIRLEEKTSGTLQTLYIWHYAAHSTFMKTLIYHKWAKYESIPC